MPHACSYEVQEIIICIHINGLSEDVTLYCRVSVHVAYQRIQRN